MRCLVERYSQSVMLSALVRFVSAPPPATFRNHSWKFRVEPGWMMTGGLKIEKSMGLELVPWSV
jgi:hypothetical protein